jgi:[ribosomal protein S5]-alanine N-acetyltransferase
MVFVVNNMQISPLSTDDAAAIYECMQDKEISDSTLRIPFPYTLQDAESWLEDNAIFEEENGLRKHFAIRNAEARLIGSVGCHFNFGMNADKSEFGYWLGKSYWNQGIMTEAIKRFCVIGRDYYHFKELQAHVFDFNLASQKALLNAGFTYVQKLPGYHTKNGQKIDAMKYIKFI